MTTDLIAQLKELESEGGRAVAGAASADDLERLRVELLGRKGPIVAGMCVQAAGARPSASAATPPTMAPAA